MNLTPGLVTSVIAIAAIVSPTLVAIINNTHQTKLKILEFRHDSRVRQFEIYYADKKAAFSEFIRAAGAFASDRADTSAYADLLSALNRALLFCDHKNKTVLHDFLGFIDSEFFSSGEDLDSYREYSERLHGVADCLSLDLESTKPRVD